jgi:trigger factor
MQQVPMSDEDMENTAKRVLGNQDEAKKIYEQVYGQKVMDLFKSKFSIEKKEVAYDEFFKSAK